MVGRQTCTDETDPEPGAVVPGYSEPGQQWRGIGWERVRFDDGRPVDALSLLVFADDHIQIASVTDVRNGTKVLQEMIKILADSLVTNWEHHYQEFQSCARKEMLWVF